MVASSHQPDAGFATRRASAEIKARFGASSNPSVVVSARQRRPGNYAEGGRLIGLTKTVDTEVARRGVTSNP